MTDHEQWIAEIEQSMTDDGEIDTEQARYLLDRVAALEKWARLARDIMGGPEMACCDAIQDMAAEIDDLKEQSAALEKVVDEARDVRYSLIDDHDPENCKSRDCNYCRLVTAVAEHDALGGGS